jgi:hypothetical protein
MKFEIKVGITQGNKLLTQQLLKPEIVSDPLSETSYSVNKVLSMITHKDSTE